MERDLLASASVQLLGTRGNNKCGRQCVRSMRLVPIYQTPNTSKKHPQHRIYLYLLPGMKIDRHSQVWCTDITYIPMRRGFLYLVAILDRATRKVLAWQLSDTLEVGFCIEALQDALVKCDAPETFNTAQGSQFTSHEFTQVLKGADVKKSMGGKGR